MNPSWGIWDEDDYHSKAVHRHRMVAVMACDRIKPRKLRSIVYQPRATCELEQAPGWRCIACGKDKLRTWDIGAARRTMVTAREEWRGLVCPMCTPMRQRKRVRREA